MPGFPGRFSRLGHRRPGARALSPAWRRLAAAGGSLAVTAALMASAVMTSATAASASAPPGYWVSTAGTSTAADTSCPTAAYNSVQQAVSAAETYEAGHAHVVPVIDICPGTYAEQVTISGSLVLTRAPVPARLGGVTIELPASVGSDPGAGLSTTNCQYGDVAQGIVPAPQSVLEICAAGPDGVNTAGVNVTARDLTVSGNWPPDVCNDSLYGILVGGGATLSLSDSTVEHVGANALTSAGGCQGGVAVQVGFAPTSQIGRAYLSDDTVRTYQKNGITVDGAGSYADIDHVVVAGSGPTPYTAQNGIQVSYGATGSVTRSSITGNNYTGPDYASAAGILVYGGGGSVCGLGADSPLVTRASFTGNTLTGNDVGIGMYNLNSACTGAASTPTRDTACANVIRNGNGYPGGQASADANVAGWSTSPEVGYQAGVADFGNVDVICDNAISGAGYAPRDAISTLPSPPPPAFVRPVDVVSGPAAGSLSYGNTFDGLPYNPG
jgi:hypothetical protein